LARSEVFRRGWAELVEQLHPFAITASGIEASDGYERGVVRTLLAAGHSVRQINPFQAAPVRQGIRCSGQERSA
jgi:transposase